MNFRFLLPLSSFRNVICFDLNAGAQGSIPRRGGIIDKSIEDKGTTSLRGLLLEVIYGFGSLQVKGYFSGINLVVISHSDLHAPTDSGNHDAAYCMSQL